MYGYPSVPVTTTSTNPYTGVSTSVTRHHPVVPTVAGGYVAPAVAPTIGYGGYVAPTIAAPYAYPTAYAPSVAYAPSIAYPSYPYAATAYAAPAIPAVSYGVTGSVPVTTTSTCPLTGVSTSVTRRMPVMGAAVRYY